MGLEVALFAAGTAVSALGQYSGGKSAKKAANAEADSTIAEARLQATKIRRLAREYRGAAKSDYAASGVVVDEGSPLEAEREITRRSEEDALLTIVGAERRARSLRKQGKAYAQAGTLGAFGSALQGGASIAAGGWRKAAGGSGGGSIGGFGAGGTPNGGTRGYA